MSGIVVNDAILKVDMMNRKLAERYGNHPALLMWHISNEYGGYCHCGRAVLALHSAPGPDERVQDPRHECAKRRSEGHVFHV